jgi:geranylgeranyl diphosphate synthase type II
MMVGAILAGADEDEVTKVEQIADSIGLAFQIKDDILDVTSTPEVLGKPIHSDEKNDKTTYVTIMNLESANYEAAMISKKAADHYKELGRSNEFLEALIITLVNREK